MRPAAVRQPAMRFPGSIVYDRHFLFSTGKIFRTLLLHLTGLYHVGKKLTGKVSGVFDHRPVGRKRLSRFQPLAELCRLPQRDGAVVF